MLWCIIILTVCVFLFLLLKNTQGIQSIEGFENHLNGIDVVYWINLDRSPERKESMEKMFKDNAFSGIPQKRISAVDGNNEDQVYDLFTVYNYNVGPKEYACTLSHLNAIKQFNESNHDIALILEDDCTLELKKYWKKSIREIMQNAPADWEIIMLNYVILPGNDHPFLKWDNDYDSDYTEVLPSATLAYIINKKGSNKIIKMKQPLNESFIRMQKIAGIVTENQINEESYSSDKMIELVKMYVDNYFDEGIGAGAVLRKLDEILDGKLDGYDIAFLKGEEDLY